MRSAGKELELRVDKIGSWNLALSKRTAGAEFLLQENLEVLRMTEPSDRDTMEATWTGSRELLLLKDLFLSWEWTSEYIIQPCQMPCMWIFRAGNMSRTVLRKARRRQVIISNCSDGSGKHCQRLIPPFDGAARCWAVHCHPGGKICGIYQGVYAIGERIFFHCEFKRPYSVPPGTGQIETGRRVLPFSAIWAGIAGKSISMYESLTVCSYKNGSRMTGFSTPWCPRRGAGLQILQL